jgi:hypothetical protein
MRKLKKMFNSYSQLDLKKVQIEQKRRRISENKVEGKWRWPTLRYYPDIRMEVLRKPEKNWGQNSLDWNQAHPETVQKRCLLNQLALSTEYEK